MGRVAELITSFSSHSSLDCIRARMRALLFALLVGCALGASVERPRRQLFGNAIDLESSLSYLPPKEEANCQPSVIYRTSVQYSTVVVPTTVYNRDVQYLTQTSVRTQQVFTTLYSEVARTQQSVRTQANTQTRYETRTRQVPTTVTRNVVSTVVVPQQVVSTVYRTNVITRIQQLPGQTRVIPSTQYSTG